MFGAITISIVVMNMRFCTELSSSWGVMSNWYFANKGGGNDKLRWTLIFFITMPIGSLNLDEPLLNVKKMYRKYYQYSHQTRSLFSLHRTFHIPLSYHCVTPWSKLDFSAKKICVTTFLNYTKQNNASVKLKPMQQQSWLWNINHSKPTRRWLRIVWRQCRIQEPGAISVKTTGPTG